MREETGCRWPIYENSPEDTDKFKRRDLCAALLVDPSTGVNAIEAGKATHQSQEIHNAHGKAQSSGECWMVGMTKNAANGKDYRAPACAEPGGDLAPHSDSPNCTEWTEVYVWAETFVLEEDGKC